ncbi:hypothetical protein ACQQ32_005619 [Pseudomonas aeruginosa]|nr:hypothetical protein [Pseudomonas aeruginosa]
MPYYDGRWHLYSEAERRAFGEAQRKAQSKAWHAKWISKHRLKTERLWTDKAIAEFLGKPRDAGPIKAWTRKEVLKAEQGLGFKAWMKERRAWLIARGKLPPAPPKKSRKEADHLPGNVIPISRARRAGKPGSCTP